MPPYRIVPLPHSLPSITSLICNKQNHYRMICLKRGVELMSRGRNKCSKICNLRCNIYAGNKASDSLTHTIHPHTHTVLFVFPLPLFQAYIRASYNVKNNILGVLGVSWKHNILIASKVSDISKVSSSIFLSLCYKVSFGLFVAQAVDLSVWLYFRNCLNFLSHVITLYPAKLLKW